MTGFSRSPRLMKGGLVTLDPTTGTVQKVIALQYNPDSLARTLQSQTTGSEGGERSEALRFKGPPVETLRVEAEIDLTDHLERGSDDALEMGLFPHLASVETLVYPLREQLRHNNTLASEGKMEIVPVEAPLLLFVWSKHRVLPIRITEFNITEEAFDTNLNPIRAKLSLGMRVLSVFDLGFGNKGGSLFMSYLEQKEGFAQKNLSVLRVLGLTGI